MSTEKQGERRVIGTCECCGQVIFEGEGFFEGNGCVFCHDCEDRGDIAQCDYCGEWHPYDDITEVANRSECYVCNDCIAYDDDIVTCVDCGAVLDRNYDGANYIESLDDFVCDECLQENYRQCEDCGEWFSDSNGDIQYINRYDAWLCEACYESRYNEEEENTVIQSYHAGRCCNRNTLTYGMVFGNKNRSANPTFGMELEIDGGGETDEHAQEIMAAATGDEFGNDLMISMHDGSLDNGIEFPFAPMSYDFFKKNIDLENMCKKALSLGYTSHNPGTCGLHMHVDRRYFEDGPCNSQDLETILLAMFLENIDWIVPFSRRKDFSYCYINGHRHDDASKITPHKQVDKVWLEDAKEKGDRYIAVNFCRDNTIEIRIFRGTLKASTIIATWQFCQMFCEFVKNCPDLDSAVEVHFEDFTAKAEERGYHEFLTYCNARGITPENRRGNSIISDEE